jgi:hypothetical protein
VEELPLVLIDDAICCTIKPYEDTLLDQSMFIERSA